MSSSVEQTEQVGKDRWVQVEPPASLIRFEDLGSRIQQLLLTLKRQVSSEEMSLLSTVTVHEMAIVFEGGTENPDILLQWLLLRAKQRRRIALRKVAQQKEKGQANEPAADPNDTTSKVAAADDDDDDGASALLDIEETVPDYKEFEKIVKAEQQELKADGATEGEVELNEKLSGEILGEENQDRLDVRLQERRAFAFILDQFGDEFDEVWARNAQLQSPACDEISTQENQGRMNVKLEERRAWGYLLDQFGEELERQQSRAESSFFLEVNNDDVGGDPDMTPLERLQAQEAQGRLDTRLQERRAFNFLADQLEQELDEIEANTCVPTPLNDPENINNEEQKARMELKLEERRAFTYLYECYSGILDKLAETECELDQVHNKEQKARLDIKLEEIRLRTYWETQMKMSRKDCQVFEAEQGHQRRYDIKHRPCRVSYADGKVELAKDAELPAALKYLINHCGEKWALHYDEKKRQVVYLHRPSEMCYDDPLEVLGIPETLDFSACIPAGEEGSSVTAGGGAEPQHPADYLLEKGVWMEVPEDEEGHTVVYWNELSNDTTYYIKEEWARPATAKPVMKALAAKRIAEEKKKREEQQKQQVSISKEKPVAVKPPTGPGPRKVFLKVWCESWNCFYYQDLRSNKTTWDHPGKECNIYSAVISRVAGGGENGEEETEEKFYKNERTESTRWDLPKEGSSTSGAFNATTSAATSMADIASMRQASIAKFQQEQPASPRVKEAPDVFVELKSEDGVTPYYMNFKTGETMWERPAVWSHSDGTPAPSDQSALARQHSVKLFKKVTDDTTGDDYYWNQRTGTTRWDLTDDPTTSPKK